MQSVESEIVSLVKKSERSEESSDALKFSQAALNVANAVATLEAMEKSNK